MSPRCAYPQQIGLSTPQYIRSNINKTEDTTMTGYHFYLTYGRMCIRVSKIVMHVKQCPISINTSKSYNMTNKGNNALKSRNVREVPSLAVSSRITYI